MIMSGRFVVCGTMLAMSFAGCSGGGGDGGGSTPIVVATSTPIATSAPGDAVTLSPATVNVDGLGATYAAQLMVSERNYTSVFTETDTCSPSTGTIATISPVSGSPTSGILAATVTAVTNGTCAVTWRDVAGHATTSTVYVTTSSFLAE